MGYFMGFFRRNNGPLIEFVYETVNDSLKGFAIETVEKRIKKEVYYKFSNLT